MPVHSITERSNAALCDWSRVLFHHISATLWTGLDADSLDNVIANVTPAEQISFGMDLHTIVCEFHIRLHRFGSSKGERERRGETN